MTVTKTHKSRLKQTSDSGSEDEVYLECRVNGEPVLGVAHGLLGLLYVLMCAARTFKKVKEDVVLMKAIKNSLTKVLCILEENEGKLLQKDGTYTVFFLNGSPGAIPVLTLAVGVFPDLKDRLLNAAQLAGELCWREGLVRQGIGLINGITGNGYALHSLFRCFNK